MGQGIAVTAAVVTYGDRGALCAQTVHGAFAAGASGAVVVDNNSHPGAAARLDELARDPRVRVVRLDHNLGSAGGFRHALVETESAEFVWLLDDDSRIEPTALRVLLDHHARLSASGRPVGLFSHRTHNAFQSATLARGYSTLPRPGSFMYFDLRDRLARRRATASGSAEGAVRVPYGPYGGLLLRRADVPAELLPNSELFLYEDDTDFTGRLSDRGVSLWLVGDSRIDDDDPKWSETASAGGSSGPMRLLAAPDSSRLFYAVRNRVRFDWRAASGIGTRVLLLANAAVFLGYTGLVALRQKQRARFLLLLDACRRGVTNDLRPREHEGAHE